MGIFVVHDETGHIDQIVINASGEPFLRPTMAPGSYFTECEPPEGLADDADVESLIEFMNTHRIETAQASTGMARVVPVTDVRR